MRIDKFLWTIRLFKTRSLATKACQNKLVMLHNELIKPSKLITANDIIAVKDLSLWRSYKIIQVPKNRIGAKLVPEHLIELTSLNELEKLNQIKETNRKNKFLGIKGRPTKKDRRDLDKFGS